MINIIWKTIPGFDNYEASNDGQIRRKNPGHRTRAGRIKKQTMNRGYLSVTINHNRYSVHRLIAIAFYGAPPEIKSEARHLDGTRTNNNSFNIAWGSRMDNITDSIKHGVTKRNGLLVSGELNGRSVVSENTVRQIKSLYEAGISQKEICAKFSLRKSIVYKILSGKTWKHIG